MKRLQQTQLALLTRARRAFGSVAAQSARPTRNRTERQRPVRVSTEHRARQSTRNALRWLHRTASATDPEPTRRVGGK